MKHLFIILLIIIGSISAEDAVKSRKLAKFDNYISVYSIQYKGVEYIITSINGSNGGISIIPAAHQNFTEKKKLITINTVRTLLDEEW